MFSDLRYVVRSLARTKGFTAVTVLTLALGIGSAAAIFSVVDWVLFRSVSFSEGLVLVGGKDKEGHFSPAISDLEVRANRELPAVFSETGVATTRYVNVVIDGEPVANSVMELSPNVLPMLGAMPVRGRGFLPGEDADGQNQVVVIRHEFWRDQFKGAEDVLGRKIIVDRTVCTVVGVLGPAQVLPAYFYGPVFRPLVYRPSVGKGWWDSWYMMLARLRLGVSPIQAEKAVAAARVDPPPEMKGYFESRQPSVATMREVAKVMRPEIYWVMLGAVGFLYAIACLNATNLMLVRMLGRKRELSIRLALGGGRWRLIRLFALESAVLSVLASAVGVLVANWLLPLLLALGQQRHGFNWSRWSLDWRVITVLCGLSVVTSFAIVLVPALRIAKTDVQEGLKEGGAGMGESRSLGRLRGLFVVLQAAFAVILLTGAGLMVRTFGKLERVTLGFNPSHRLKLTVNFPNGYVQGKEERLAMLKRLQDHLLHVPGVLSLGFGTDSLLPGYFYQDGSVQLADGKSVKVKMDYISADYLEATGMTLKKGRRIAAGGEVMINEAFARVRFGEADPIGQLMKPTNDKGGGGGGWLVVGVVGDVRDTLRTAPGYHVYVPETWYPPAMNTFILRVAREPDGALSSAVKRAVWAFDPKIVASYVGPLEQMREWQSGLERFVLSVLKALSGMALVLTIVGVFSVLAYTVDQRMTEFGVRLAVGATPRDLVTLVVRRGVALVLVGVVTGVAGALALTRTLKSLLYETVPYDPLVLTCVAGLLVVAATLACTLPALRATKADVAQLLRRE